MRTTVSPSALKAMFATETDEVFLILLRISGAGLAPIYLVNNTEPVSVGNVTYVNFPFSIQLPDDTDDIISNVEVQFDNIDDMITDAIRTLNGRPDVSFDVVLASDPSHVEAGPYNFQILSTQYDREFIRCSLGFEENILNQAVPKGLFTPSNSPGLFV